MGTQILGVVDHLPGPVRARVFVMAAALVAMAAGCGGSINADQGTALPPNLVETQEFQAKPSAGGSVRAKTRLARNRPPQFLDPRIGK